MPLLRDVSTTRMRCGCGFEKIDLTFYLRSVFMMRCGCVAAAGHVGRAGRFFRIGHVAIFSVRPQRMTPSFSVEFTGFMTFSKIVSVSPMLKWYELGSRMIRTSFHRILNKVENYLPSIHSNMIESVSTTNNLCRRLKTKVTPNSCKIRLCIRNFRVRSACTRNASASWERLLRLGFLHILEILTKNKFEIKCWLSY